MKINLVIFMKLMRPLLVFCFICVLMMSGCSSIKYGNIENIEPDPPVEDPKNNFEVWYGSVKNWASSNDAGNAGVSEDGEQADESAEETTVDTPITKGLSIVQDVLASGGEVPPGGWTFEERSIVLRINPLEGVNYYEGREHALYVGIFQLRDPTVFSTLSKSKSGLIELLQAKTLDPSVLSVEKVFVQPGRTYVAVLDRALGAQFVGLIAGYFDMDVNGSVGLVPIPGVSDSDLGVGGVLSKVNPFGEGVPIRPGRMKIWAYMGEKAIVKLVARAF